MAKKTTSVHLEEDIWNEIDKYKEEHNLSSRNTAIERMLLERRMLLKCINLQARIPVINEDRKIENIENENLEDDDLLDSIDNSFSEIE